MVLRDHNYTIEPTGADSLSQNGAVEIYNNKFAIRICTLLYGANLPAKYWSAALLHATYLHNRLVHSATKQTPFKGFFGFQPNLSHLKVFGSCVCVKRSGNRAAKLDKNSFTGIFLSYTATDNNILYLDVRTGIVKCSHHALFDEAWYLQPTCPPAAQLLYDLGIEPGDIYHPATGPINNNGKSMSSPPEKNTSINAPIPQIANKSPGPTPDKSLTTVPPLLS